jgi:hypothetical protein
MRRAFWKNFGTDLDQAWRTWPEQEFHDAVSVLNSEASSGRASSGGVSAEVTQASFDALPRVKREPPPESSGT